MKLSSILFVAFFVPHVFDLDKGTFSPGKKLREKKVDLGSFLLLVMVDIFPYFPQDPPPVTLHGEQAGKELTERLL